MYISEACLDYYARDLKEQLPQVKPGHVTPDQYPRHKRQVYADLRKIGADNYDMWLPETNYLPSILHADEQLIGVVYGRYQQKGRYGEEPKTLSTGRGMLAVTNQRILFLDKKPMFLRSDTIPRAIVSGITFSKTLFGAYIGLHTRAGDFSIRTYNPRAAEHFVEAVKALCFDQKNKMTVQQPA